MSAKWWLFKLSQWWNNLSVTSVTINLAHHYVPMHLPETNSDLVLSSHLFYFNKNEFIFHRIQNTKSLLSTLIVTDHQCYRTIKSLQTTLHSNTIDTYNIGLYIHYGVFLDSRGDFHTSLYPIFGYICHTDTSLFTDRISSTNLATWLINGPSYVRT